MITACPGRGHVRHATITCSGSCCTFCGGPIDDEGACRCADNDRAARAKELGSTGRLCEVCGAPTPYTDWKRCEKHNGCHCSRGGGFVCTPHLEEQEAAKEAK